jgi:DNA-binding SARP family transcriptional activator/ABC-type branched-subunit amino acid transport system substrate-binding protein/DNA-binding beta-propeller fold protein YncE
VGVKISLTGRVSIEANGAKRDERSFPGRQGRLVFAYLLAEEGRAVPRDELAEVLWGDAPPATWEKALSVLVSKLRALLEDCGIDGQAALRSAFGCYQLVLPPGAWIDLAAAREATGRARAALDAGDIGAAREAAVEVVALARRRFLPGEDGAWVDEKRRELSELLVRALECLADACVAAGDAREAVRHAEELITLEPYREGGYRRLMQAHAAAGDSAEALRVYERCRRLLADELGAYPSPETESIYRDLLQASSPGVPAARPETGLPAIEPEPERAGRGETASPRARPRSRRPLLAAALGAVVLAIAAGAALQGFGGDEEVEGAGALALDPESGDVVARVRLGTAPSAVAVGEGSVWVVDADDRTVSQIDAETRKLVRTFSTSATPTDVAVGAGSVWIANAPSAGNLLPTSITRLGAETGLVVDTIDLGSPPGGYLGHLFAVLAGLSRQHIAAAEDAVWVINPDLTVSRIDPRTNRIVARIEDVRAENIAVGDGEVWLTEGDRLAEIDPSVNAVARRVQLDVELELLAGLAVGAGAVWVADPQGGNLWRVDTGPNAARRAVPLETWVAGVSFGEGAVWVTNEIGDAVHRVDPRTGAPEQVGEATSPRGVDAGEGRVWLTAASPPSEDAALPASVCRDVYYSPEGSPDVLIVSSLPLQGDGRQFAQPMVDAIRHVLKQRGFEAGAFSVGYQSCDSSTAQAGGEDFFRCGFIAKAFSRNLRVVGVFGSFTSPCSYPQIPIANEAPGGPLAMISPSNTIDDLTTDDDLYPTGTRNYFRLATPVRYQGFAQVELARQLGHRRLFLLTSRAGEYPSFPEGMRAYAKRVGVHIVGEASFDPDAETFQQLVGEVSRSRPDSVAIVGILTPETGALIRELRAALGRHVSLTAPDAFYWPEALRKLARDAAEGMYVTNYGIPNDMLPPRGKAFLKSFVSERGGDAGPDFAASYGAQGAEILLDAIARSDGTRASVREEIRRTQVRNGILGNVAFDAKGDLVERPMTILRFARGDFVVDRVVRVRPPVSSR